MAAKAIILEDKHPFHYAAIMKRRISSFLLALFVLSPTAVLAQFEGMKSRIPTDANTLVLINAEKLLHSPEAGREQWAAKLKAAYDAGIIAVSPDATQVLIAGRSDHEYGKTIWELGMVKYSGDRGVTDVAARFGGSIDDIGGRSAARLPDDHYVVQLGPSIMATYTPANRQDVGNWLRSTDTIAIGSKLPSYLETAFSVYAEKVGTPIVMAMDLAGAMSAQEIRQRAESFEMLQGKNISLDEIAKVIAGVQGITLGVTAQDQTIGAIRVDFSESPEILSEIGKPLLLEILSRQGAMIDDLNGWEPSVSGNTFKLQGILSDSGLRRLMSVLELPSTLTAAAQEAASPSVDQEAKSKLLATQQYWKSINSLMDDLRRKPKEDHVKTFGQAAVWYDKYARKIDRMPILNVDEQLLDFGAMVSTSFRNAEGIMKNVGIRTSLRTASNNPTSGGYSNSSFGGYRANSGYFGVDFGPMGVTGSVSAMNASLQAKGQGDAIIRGEERASGASNVQQIWQQLDQATATMRRELVSKYSADF